MTLDLTVAVEWTESAEEASADARRQAERDRDFRDGIQWTASETSLLAARGQPVITVNRIGSKVDFLMGYEQQMRSDPKAMPRTPKHEQEAESATDALRFVAEKTNFQEVASAVWENQIVEGFGGCELRIKPKRDGGVEIIADHIPWDRLFFDPHSRRKDFSDAKYLGVVVWSDMEDAKANFPGKDKYLNAAVDGNWTGASGNTSDDRPLSRTWADKTRQRVKLVELHWREGGDWYQATLCRAGYLRDPAKSPFVNEDGEATCPIYLCSAYVNRDNDRYGAVRQMIGPQEEINKRRSKALHLLSMRQVIADEGAVLDEDAARRELAKPDGFIKVAPGLRFDVQQTGDLAAGQVNLLQEAKNEIDLMGPNPSLQGKEARDLSGRALISQQQGGAVVLKPLINAHREWKLRVYRGIWALVRQYWTGETWVRVTDDERNLKWVGMNKPVTLADEIGNLPPEQQAEIAQKMGLVPNDPRLSQVLRVENPVAELDCDIVLDESPDVTVIRQEQFETLAGLAKAGLPIPPDALIEASDVRNKDKILEAMKGGGDDPGKAQAIAKAAMLEIEGKAADVAKTKAETDKLQAETAKIGGDAAIKDHEAMMRAAAPPGLANAAPMGAPQPPPGF